jgi:putative hydrolase of the HAD superfamily
MIKNIIFDLGNVLISFRPAEYLEKNHYPPNIIEVILNEIFRSREWTLIDNGDITTAEAIDILSVKSSLKKAEITEIFNLRTDIMFPLEKNSRLLPVLKLRNFKLYYLSNFPIDIFPEIKDRFDFFRYFDGGLISSEVRFSKPQPEIYRILLEKYKLNAYESLFIDDYEGNTKAAENLGMKVLFTAGSTDISSDLKKFFPALADNS